MTSRRDSFITHRAFCDALAEESARAITANPLLPSQQQQPPSSSHHMINNLQTQFNNPQQQQQDHHHLHAFPLKKEQQHHQQQQSFNLGPEIVPPWLGPPIFSPRLDQQQQHQLISQTQQHQDQNPNPSLGPTLPPYQTVPASPHMSATALLQKAAQMGATMTRTGSASSPVPMIRTHHQDHVSGLNSSSREDHNTTTNSTTTTTTSAVATTITTGFGGHGLSPFENINKAATAMSSVVTGVPQSFLHDVINSFSSNSPSAAFEGTPFEDAFGGILNSKKDQNLHDTLSNATSTATATATHLACATDDGGGGNEGLSTRDFLGLRPLSHSDILSIAGIGGNYMNDQGSHSHQKPWQG